MADSLRAAAKAVSSGRFWALVMSIASAAAIGVNYALSVAKWSNERASTKDVIAASERIDALERRTLVLEQSAFRSMADTTASYRELAAAVAGALAKRDRDAAAQRARDRFNNLILGGRTPIDAFAIVVRSP